MIKYINSKRTGRNPSIRTPQTMVNFSFNFFSPNAIGYTYVEYFC